MPNFEYERKFLVSDRSIVSGGGGAILKQGYLGCAPGYSIRVRYQQGLASSHGADIATTSLSMHISESGYTLTAKGPRSAPATRQEEEIPIPLDLGELMMTACGTNMVHKIRHPIAGPDGEMWIVDVFQGLNEGLWLAELERQSPSGAFTKPDWCGDDVTEDDRYYNDYLSRHPFTTWTNDSDSAE